MRTLFIIDPIDRLNLAGDSSWMLMVETARRGWPMAWCEPKDLQVREDGPVAWARDLQVQEEPARYEHGERRLQRLGDFDCVWMRKDPPFDMDYVFCTYMLDLAPRRTLVLNDPRAIKCDNEKMFALNWPELLPPTRVTNRVEDILDFARQHDRVVIKPWDGNGGRGVLVTHADDLNLRSMAELLTQEGRAWCIAQTYLPEVRSGDKRIILVDGEPRGWFLRVPSDRDHRGNMHVGATVQACALSEADQRICAAIGPRLKAEGLVFVGIDVIGSCLTEINVTSPTGLQEVRRLMGLRLERELVDAALRRYTARLEERP